MEIFYIGILKDAGYILFGILFGVLIMTPEVLKTRKENKKVLAELEEMKKKFTDSGITFESDGLGLEGEGYRNN